MKAAELYERLERDFIVEGLWDEWAKYMGGLSDLLCGQFKARSMGLVCDFAGEVTAAYTAVFPTEEVMGRIIDGGARDALLFVHHPSVWDLRRAPKGFYQMDRALVEKFRERRIAIYNLHVPLDNFGAYSTSRTLAEALGLEIVRPFAPYRGALCGVIGRTGCKTVEELNGLFSAAVGHRTRLYLYGDSAIRGGRVAVVAGGGNMKDVVAELLSNDVRVLVTGLSLRNEISAEVHHLEQNNGINVLGGTHYSTEKFACQKMCAYFGRLGLPANFVAGEPCYDDM